MQEVLERYPLLTCVMEKYKNKNQTKKPTPEVHYFVHVPSGFSRAHHLKTVLLELSLYSSGKPFLGYVHNTPIC